MTPIAYSLQPSVQRVRCCSMPRSSAAAWSYSAGTQLMFRVTPGMQYGAGAVMQQHICTFLEDAATQWPLGAATHFSSSWSVSSMRAASRESSFFITFTVFVTMPHILLYFL